MWPFKSKAPAAAAARTLVVNEVLHDTCPIRVNMVTTVNTSKIRTEQRDGREVMIIPSFTLPDDVVMNGGLYPRDEIERSYKSLEGKLAPLEHPEVDGQFVSAQHPQAINRFHIGAWNENVRRDGHRIAVDKCLDVNYAKQTEGGRRLLERIEEGGPVHTSTGIFLNREQVANSANAGYSWIARDMVFDHDAILLDNPGAATPDDGVGLLVNARVEEAKPVSTNAVFGGLSYQQRQRLLTAAAQAKWGPANGNKWVYVEDFDDVTAVVITEGEGYKAVGYTLNDGQVTFADDAKKVEQKTSWVDTVNSFWQSLRGGVNSAGKDQPPKAGDSDDMDRKELDEALAANQTATLAAVKDLLAPLAASVTAVQTNQAKLEESLTANSRAAEKAKRDVVEQHWGKTVADALTGNALDEAHAKLTANTDGTAAPIVPGFQGNANKPQSYEVPE